jgi:hypothetical protein
MSFDLSGRIAVVTSGNGGMYEEGILRAPAAEIFKEVLI